MQPSFINMNTNDSKKSQPMLSNDNNSKKVQSTNPPPQVLQQKSALQKMKLSQRRSNKNNSQMNAIFATNRHQQQKKNPSKLQQFAQAWKSQTNFSILLIEKLSLIVSNYFKILGEMTQRSQQIQTLIIYNKGLIEVLTKFQDQQRKLIQKVNTLEEFNIKIMKQLCSLKKRPFEPPEVRRQQSIFQKFSLKKFKYERQANKQNKQDEDYRNKIVNLFKGYLLQKNDHFIPIIQNKLKKLQQSNNADKKMSLQTTNRVQELNELLQDVIIYNKNLENVTYENIFDLYELKWQIKNQMKSQNLDMTQKDEEGKEKMFVDNIKKIHANLSNLNENQLQNYLKKQKQIRKKIKRERIKQQQIFLRACQETQNQKLQLKLDNAKLKDKMVKVQQQLSKIKAQNQFKWMKQRRSNKNSNEQNLNDQKKIKIDAQLKILREESQKLSQQNQSLSQQNQNFSKQNQKMKKQFAGFQQQKKRMIQRVKYNQVALEQNPSYETIINALIQAISYWKIKAGLANEFLQKEGISPKIEQDKQFESAVSNKALKEKKIKNDSQKFEMQIEQLKKRNNQLEKKQEQYKKLEAQILKKAEKQKTQLSILQSQINKKEIQFSKKSAQLNKKENQIIKKNARIKQIQKQLQIIQHQFDVMKKRNKQLQSLNQSAQKLTRNIMKAVQTLITEDFNSQKFLVLMDNMFQNLQRYVKQYQQQTKKQIQVWNLYNVKLLQENTEHFFTKKFKKFEKPNSLLQIQPKPSIYNLKKQQQNESSQIFNIKIYAPPQGTSINMAESSPFLTIPQKQKKTVQQKEGKGRQKKQRKSTHTNKVSQTPKISLPLANHQQKQVQNPHINERISSSRPPQMIDVNLSYSQEQQVLANSIYINPNSYLTPHVGRGNNGFNSNHSNNTHNNQNNSKKNYQSYRLDKSALQVGIQILYIQKMQQKFKRLHNDDDALDFFQLFQRYKQTLKCLQTSQRINRLHQIRYNRFIGQVLQQKQQNPSYIIQQQLHNLSKFALKQQRLLEQQKYQFENSFIEHIKTSQKNIQHQLKFMRISYMKKK